MIETQDESITIDVTAVNHEKYYISESPVVWNKQGFVGPNYFLNGWASLEKSVTLYKLL